MRLRTLTPYLTASILALLPSVSSARLSTAGLIQPPNNVGVSIQNIYQLYLCGALNYLFTFAIIFSVIMAVLTGIEYMTSKGDPEGVRNAHRRLVFTAVGIAVALSCRAFPKIIGVILGASLSGNIC